MMTDIMLLETEKERQVQNGNNIIVPHLDSCCLVIAWYANGDIHAQHCQDTYYKDACNISSDPDNNRIVQAVYITAKKTEEQETHIRELNEQLNPKKAVYYSHRTSDNDVHPVVTLQGENGYVLFKEEDYDRIEL